MSADLFPDADATLSLFAVTSGVVTDTNGTRSWNCMPDPPVCRGLATCSRHLFCKYGGNLRTIFTIFRGWFKTFMSDYAYIA